MNSLAFVLLALALHCVDSQSPSQRMDLVFNGNSVSVKFMDASNKVIASEDGSSTPGYQTAQEAFYDLDGSHAYDCGRGVSLSVDQSLLAGSQSQGNATVSVAGNYGCADETEVFSCSR